MKKGFIYILIGLAGGTVGGFMGVGGGIIMIPLLTWLGLTQKRAQGTSLAATVPLAIVGLIIYYHEAVFDPAIVTPLAIGGVIGAILGTGLVRRFSNQVLYKLFGIFLLLVAVRHGITTFMVETGAGGEAHVSPLIAGMAGLGAGLVSGFFGVGGGVVFVPAGVQLLGLGEKIAHGVSFAAIIPTALVGVFRYRVTKDIVTVACLPLIVGAVIGSIASSIFATGLKDDTLAIAFTIFLTLVGIKRLMGRNTQKR